MQRKNSLHCVRITRDPIARLNEAHKNVYERLINTSAQPISVPWALPDSIDFYVPDDSIKFEQHLYCSEDGTFQTSLNS